MSNVEATLPHQNAAVARDLQQQPDDPHPVWFAALSGSDAVNLGHGCNHNFNPRSTPDVEIQEGSQASSEFLRVHFGDVPEAESRLSGIVVRIGCASLVAYAFRRDINYQIPDDPGHQRRLGASG